MGYPAFASRAGTVLRRPALSAIWVPTCDALPIWECPFLRLSSLPVCLSACLFACLSGCSQGYSHSRKCPGRLGSSDQRVYIPRNNKQEHWQMMKATKVVIIIIYNNNNNNNNNNKITTVMANKTDPFKRRYIANTNLYLYFPASFACFSDAA